MNKATILKVDGTEEELDHRPTLEEAWKIVDGYIELVKGKYNGKAVTLVVNEDGRMLGKERNDKATKIYQDNWIGPTPSIVGDVILLEGWKTVG